jgi:hypothetical protein
MRTVAAALKFNDMWDISLRKPGTAKQCRSATRMRALHVRVAENALPV